ncbi:hypothetical protein BVI434_980019 [Burkholderia vietnamiensis]|nr:hypothetical protein BVI2075_530125 [Burkholderia vietnamiensis]CAG9234897.1 hypothetical protein BVI434_980019 [Burkholderia vietnamiensis]
MALRRSAGRQRRHERTTALARISVLRHLAAVIARSGRRAGDMVVAMLGTRNRVAEPRDAPTHENAGGRSGQYFAIRTGTVADTYHAGHVWSLVGASPWRRIVLIRRTRAY